MQINPGELEIQHRPEAERFEIHIGGHTAVLDYRLNGKTIMFTHTGVPPALEGRGIGSRIVRAGLEYARRQGCRVTPACSFVAAYIRRHPEYQELVK